MNETMDNAIDVTRKIAALTGVAVCLVAGVSRLMGNYYVAGFEAMTMFDGGVGLMVFSCVAKLHLMTHRTHK